MKTHNNAENRNNNCQITVSRNRDKKQNFVPKLLFMSISRCIHKWPLKWFQRINKQFLRTLTRTRETGGEGETLESSWIVVCSTYNIAELLDRNGDIRLPAHRLPSNQRGLARRLRGCQCPAMLNRYKEWADLPQSSLFIISLIYMEIPPCSSELVGDWVCENVCVWPLLSRVMSGCLCSGRHLSVVPEGGSDRLLSRRNVKTICVLQMGGSAVNTTQVSRHLRWSAGQWVVGGREWSRENNSLG